MKKIFILLIFVLLSPITFATGTRPVKTDNVDRYQFNFNRLSRFFTPVNVGDSSDVLTLLNNGKTEWRAPLLIDTINLIETKFDADQRFSQIGHSQGITTITHLPDSLLARYTKTQANAMFAPYAHTQAQTTITSLPDSLLARYTKTQANYLLASATRQITTSGTLRGGGDLTANRALSIVDSGYYKTTGGTMYGVQNLYSKDSSNPGKLNINSNTKAPFNSIYISGCTNSNNINLINNSNQGGGCLKLTNSSNGWGPVLDMRATAGVSPIMKWQGDYTNTISWMIPTHLDYTYKLTMPNGLGAGGYLKTDATGILTIDAGTGGTSDTNSAPTIWTALSGTYVSATSFSITGNGRQGREMVGKIFFCNTSTGARIFGYIASYGVVSGTLTLTVRATANLSTGAKNFRVAYGKGVARFSRTITLYGPQIADVSNYQGMYYFSQDTTVLIAYSAWLDVAASGTSADLRYNLYAGASPLGSAIVMSTNAYVLNSQPTTSIINPNTKLSLYITLAGGGTTWPFSFQCEIISVSVNEFKDL